MSRALAGGSGFITSRDSQGELGAAAYMRLAPWGWHGAADDAAELYQPIREQVRYVLPILLFLLAGGAL